MTIPVILYKLFGMRADIGEVLEIEVGQYTFCTSCCSEKDYRREFAWFGSNVTFTYHWDNLGVPDEVPYKNALGIFWCHFVICRNK